MKKMQKKGNKYLLPLLGVIVTLLFIVGIRLSNHYRQPPLKPDSVPCSAVWYGGVDGGFWFDLVEIRGDTVRFKFYDDWNGDCYCDASFIPERKDSRRLSTENWEVHDFFFDGIYVYCRERSDSNYKRMIPVASQYY